MNNSQTSALTQPFRPVTDTPQIQVTLNTSQPGAPAAGFTFGLSLLHADRPIALSEFLQPKYASDRSFCCLLDWNSSSKRYTRCVRGDESLWIPTDDQHGLKIVLDSTPEQFDHVCYLQERCSLVFPRIDWVALGRLHTEAGHRPCLVIRMEEVAEDRSTFRHLRKDLTWSLSNRWSLRWEALSKVLLQARRLLQCPLYAADACTREFSRWHLMPEDEWYKPTNLIDGKCVDFHRFEFMPTRYAFPSAGLSLAGLRKLYEAAPRAKNRNHTLYQGFRFDNGYSMPGYSSDGCEFDSYRKLPFLSLRSARNGRVLDLGCSEGFFSFQAALHGAAEVIALEKVPELLAFASQLNRDVFHFKQLAFMEEDIVPLVMNHRVGKVDLTFLLSVLHLIHPHLDNADAFLQRLSTMTRRLVFETPIAHPQMHLSLPEIYSRLKSHFPVVRLLYVYDAYSSGHRALFVCYGVNH